MGRPGVRQQLLEAALEVFQYQGFNGASVQDLTDAAGVPKGSFYNHFSGKEELALAALELYIGQNGIEILSDEKLAPMDRLKRHFKTNWKVVRERNYHSGCFLGSLSSEIAGTHETSRVKFARYFELWSMAIAGVIAQAQAAGEANDAVEASVLARFVLNAWQGTLVRAKATKDEQPFKDFVAVTFGTMLAPAARN